VTDHWQESPQVDEVIQPIIHALVKRGHKTKIGKGFWRNEYKISIDKGPEVMIRVSGGLLATRPRVGSSRRSRRLVMIGPSRRGTNKSRFPEPKMGFNFEWMAICIEQWTESLIKRERLEKERSDSIVKWQKYISKLPKELRAYTISIDTRGAGADVTLHVLNAQQLEDVLKAAYDIGVEP